MEASGIESQVCHDIAARQQVGLEKYGTTVADNPLPLRDWLEHAYQECLDQAIYLRRAMAELDSKASVADRLLSRLKAANERLASDSSVDL